MPPLTKDPAPPEIDIVDNRQPLYLGDWKRSIPYVDEDIAVDNLDEPHMKRKITILKEHPEIEKLYGYDIRTAYVSVISSMVQLGLAYYFGKVHTEGWLLMAVTAYFIGGSFTALYGVLIHEATHCLAAPTRFGNRMVGIIANLGLPVPIAMSFRRYHLEHHTFQGVVGLDPDLPLEWEKTLIQGNTLMKVAWLFIFPVMYVVRGAAQNKTPSKWEIINLVVIILNDIFVVYFFGWRAMAYMFLSLWFGYSLHPGAAHFIQEHYTFDDGQETYSYYGMLNSVFMNIGYHNEHHDFTKVPWSNLPAVRAIASKYYDSLAYHTSWFMVHWNFIFSRALGPQSRVGRDLVDHKKGRRMLNKIRED